MKGWRLVASKPFGLKFTLSVLWEYPLKNRKIMMNVHDEEETTRTWLGSDLGRYIQAAYEGLSADASLSMKALYLERAERAKRSTRGVNCARIGKEHIIALKSKGVCDCDESGKSRESEKEL